MPNDNFPDSIFHELVELNHKLDQQLTELREAEKQIGRRVWRWARRLLPRLALLVSSLLLPFVVLVRVSVFLYTSYQLNGWLAILVGMVATISLLLIYGLVVAYYYGNSLRIHKYFRRGVAVLVGAYTLYGLIYFSSLNTKTEEVRSYYRSLHPIMRVALTTMALSDDELMVTDIKRRPEDYVQMGLPKNPYSLHYIQPDGYIHAVDLRTRGQSDWQVWLTQISLELIGLHNIRHVGTADHLHVYIPMNE